MNFSFVRKGPPRLPYGYDPSLEEAKLEAAIMNYGVIFCTNHGTHAVIWWDNDYWHMKEIWAEPQIVVL